MSDRAQEQQPGALEVVCKWSSRLARHVYEHPVGTAVTLVSTPALIFGGPVVAGVAGAALVGRGAARVHENGGIESTMEKIEEKARDLSTVCRAVADGVDKLGDNATARQVVGFATAVAPEVAAQVVVSTYAVGTTARQVGNVANQVAEFCSSSLSSPRPTV